MNGIPDVDGEGLVLRAFFGHHKTASTWVRSILADVAAVLDLDQRTIHTAANHAPYATLADMVEAEQPDLLCVTDPKREVVDSLPPMRGLHLIRDPRDVIVSGYFSHLHSHPISFGGVEWPEMATHRAELRSLDQDAGMLTEIEFSSPFVESMATWNYDQPGMLEMKMEDLIADPVRHFTTIFEHLKLLAPHDDLVPLARSAWNLAPRRGKPPPVAWLRRALHLPRLPMRRVSPAYVSWTLDRYSFQRLSGGRAPGVEDVTSHYRRGVAGDWRNHLNDKHLAAIRDRFGDIVERLGYV